MPSQKGHSADDHRKISERDRDNYDEVLKCMFNELHGLRMEAQDFNKHFRDLLRFLECKPKQTRERLFVLEIEGEDEPINKGTMRVKLSKPIAPGFQRKVNLTPDEPVDVREDGTFAVIEPVEGDSTIVVRPESDKNKIRLLVRGDGTLGTGKVARVVSDGRIGPEAAPFSIELEWDVAHKDATEFSAAIEEEGPDEAIPV